MFDGTRTFNNVTKEHLAVLEHLKTTICYQEYLTIKEPFGTFTVHKHVKLLDHLTTLQCLRRQEPLLVLE